MPPLKDTLSMLFFEVSTQVTHGDSPQNLTLLFAKKMSHLHPGKRMASECLRRQRPWRQNQLFVIDERFVICGKRSTTACASARDWENPDFM